MRTRVGTLNKWVCSYVLHSFTFRTSHCNNCVIGVFSGGCWLCTSRLPGCPLKGHLDHSVAGVKAGGDFLLPLSSDKALRTDCNGKVNSAVHIMLVKDIKHNNSLSDILHHDLLL